MSSNKIVHHLFFLLGLPVVLAAAGAWRVGVFIIAIVGLWEAWKVMADAD